MAPGLIMEGSRYNHWLGASDAVVAVRPASAVGGDESLAQSEAPAEPRGQDDGWTHLIWRLEPFPHVCLANHPSPPPPPPRSRSPNQRRRARRLRQGKRARRATAARRGRRALRPPLVARALLGGRNQGRRARRSSRRHHHLRRTLSGTSGTGTSGSLRRASSSTLTTRRSRTCRLSLGPRLAALALVRRRGCVGRREGRDGMEDGGRRGGGGVGGYSLNPEP